MENFSICIAHSDNKHCACIEHVVEAHTNVNTVYIHKRPRYNDYYYSNTLYWNPFKDTISEKDHSVLTYIELRVTAWVLVCWIEDDTSETLYVKMCHQCYIRNIQRYTACQSVLYVNFLMYVLSLLTDLCKLCVT